MQYSKSKYLGQLILQLKKDKRLNLNVCGRGKLRWHTHVVTHSAPCSQLGNQCKELNGKHDHDKCPQGRGQSRGQTHWPEYSSIQRDSPARSARRGWTIWRNVAHYVSVPSIFTAIVVEHEVCRHHSHLLSREWPWGNRHKFDYKLVWDMCILGTVKRTCSCKRFTHCTHSALIGGSNAQADVITQLLVMDLLSLPIWCP